MPTVGRDQGKEGQEESEGHQEVPLGKEEMNFRMVGWKTTNKKGCPLTGLAQSALSRFRVPSPLTSTQTKPR